MLSFATSHNKYVLQVPELEALLNPDTTPLTVSKAPPPYPPPSGTLILYDRETTRHYKDDGYDWIKKRNSQKVREDHVKLRVGGRYRVAGCYVHSSTNPNFHRRAYHLLDPETGGALHPPSRRTSADSAAAALLSNTGSPAVISQVVASVGSASASPGAGACESSTRGGGRSLVLVHYLDTDMAALHLANVDDTSEGSGSRGSRSRGSSLRRRKRRIAEPVMGVTDPEKTAALQAQAAQVAQFQQQQALSELLHASLKEQNVSGLTPQQIHQLATAQLLISQQTHLQQQMSSPMPLGNTAISTPQPLAAAVAPVAAATTAPGISVSGTVPVPTMPVVGPGASMGPSIGSTVGTIPSMLAPLASMGGAAVGSLGGAEIDLMTPAPVSMPPPAPMTRGGMASTNGGDSAANDPLVTRDSSLLAAAASCRSPTPTLTPTPALGPSPLAASRGGYSAASLEPQPLRNEEQLSKLQVQLHQQEQEAKDQQTRVTNNTSAAVYAAAPAPADTVRSDLNSKAMDNDTLNILWGMIVEEGGGGPTGNGIAGDTKAGVESAGALADMLDDDEKIGDMLEDAEGLLFTAGDIGSDVEGSINFDYDVAADAVADVLSQTDRKRSADDTLDNTFEAEAGVGTEEENHMAAITASAVSAFEQELRDARTAAPSAPAAPASLGTSNAPTGLSPPVAYNPPVPATSPAYPSLESQIAALQTRRLGLLEQQQEAERQIELAQHQHLQQQLQQRGTLQPAQLAQATGVLEQQMRSQTMNNVGTAASSSAVPVPGVTSREASLEGSQVGSQMSEEKLGDRLPDLVDFTPEVADLPVSAEAPPKVMLSCSGPLPPIPLADGKIFLWHSLAAYVSASVNAADGAVLDILKLDLSPVQQINPYTLKTSVPTTAMLPGERRIIVFAVQLYTGTNPICEGVAAGVAAALRQAWAIAVQADGTGAVPTLAKKPIFMNTTDLASGQIKLLTQFSDDTFVLRCKQ